MTRVRFGGRDGGYFFRCDGHAGAAEKGHDIVCSAVSILGYTLAENTKKLYDEGFLIGEPIINIKDGFIEIEMKPHKGAERDVRRTIAVVQTGYLLLSAAYPSFVSLDKTI